MRQLLVFLMLAGPFYVFAQKTIQSTDHFIVTGAVKQEITFSLKDIKSLPSQKIKNLAITNHAGEKRERQKNYGVSD